MKSAPVKSKGSFQKPARAAAPTNASGSKARSTGMMQPVTPTKESAGLHWTFLTNHAHVLVLLSRNTSLVLREVALQVGITERAVQRIIADLEAGGIIEREKIGRQNHYRIRTHRPLRHPVEAHRKIGDLLALFSDVPE